MNYYSQSYEQNLIDQYGRKGLGNDTESPIFIFATGERCGSTLIQRLLCTHPEIFIWGEQRGALNDLLSFYIKFYQHAVDYKEVPSLFFNSLENEFIANLSPGISSLENALRSILKMLYGGYSGRWGCKEVRCGIKVAFLIETLFPQSKFILLTRHIGACLASLLRWNYDLEKCVNFVNRWESLTSQMVKTSKLDSTNYLFLRYEDFIGNSQQQIEVLCKFLNIEKELLDLNTLKIRVADHKNIENIDVPKPRVAIPLPKEVQALISTEKIQDLLKRLNYTSDYC